MSYEKELEVALDAAKSAGNYLIDNINESSEKQAKGGAHNFSLRQDLESEKVIFSKIRASFPDDYILSEESATELTNQTRSWIVDPLDGTVNYANGIGYFAVAIALYEAGEVKVGVVYDPSSDEMFHSIKGQGMFLNGNKLNMRNPEANIKESLIITGFAYLRGEDMKSTLANIGRAVNISNGVRRFGAAALDLCYIAAGRVGASFEAGLKPWDVAAGSLFVEEMGGVVSSYNRPLNMFRMVDGKLSVEIMASKNQKIHSELKKILKI